MSNEMAVNSFLLLSKPLDNTQPTTRNGCSCTPAIVACTIVKHSGEQNTSSRKREPERPSSMIWGGNAA